MRRACFAIRSKAGVTVAGGAVRVRVAGERADSHARGRQLRENLATGPAGSSNDEDSIHARLFYRRVRIAAFGEEMPVRFDVNTGQPGILRLIPGISETEIGSWLGARSAKPFTGRADFQARAGLRPAILAAPKF